MAFMSTVELPNGKTRVALGADQCSGVFELPGPLPAHDRIKYLTIPDEFRIGESWEALAYFRAACDRIAEPTQKDWDRARAGHEEDYDNGQGISRQKWWVGTLLDGTEVPCTETREIGGY